jgi:hypothetical protein
METVIAVVLMSLLSTLHINSEAPDDDAFGNQIVVALKQFKADFDLMKASGKIDDKKLISGLGNILDIMKSGLEKLSEPARSRISVHIAELQGKIQRMESSGKFDASIFD